MLDPAKLASPEANGIFETNPLAYEDYRGWRINFVGELRTIVMRNSMRSSTDVWQVRSLVDKACAVHDRERVFNALLSDMLQAGATWEHLAALTFASGRETNPFPEHAGKLYLLIADWILWHQTLLDPQ